MKINKDFEHIILWMLYNNNVCSWSDFKSDPVNISQATLSKYLSILISNGFIEKEMKGKYKITPEGRKKYADLQVKDALEKSLNYPPETITNKRNYDDWILWMLYNNHHCKWSDFLEEPLRINQSSLSKNLNLLLEKGYVEKNNREYQITSSGELEYFNMLKKYDLDRQSILNEEIKRVEVVTDKVAEFFNEYDIADDGIKYRFLNMVMKLDYTQFETSVSDEEDIDKILLYLAINHPDQYPKYITAKDFALEYDIKLTTLDFFIDKIVDEKNFAIKFFKLNVSNKYDYYIQAEERLEKMLNVIIEDYIRKFTYLSKFQKASGVQYQIPDINDLLEEITSEMCSNLFHDDLRPALKKFLPEYIEHLAYKFESEKSLINHTDKIKGIAFQNVFEVIQSFDTSETASTINKSPDSEAYYFLHNRIFDTLDIFYLTKINFIRTSQFKKTYFPNNSEFLTKIEHKLAKGKLSKVNDLLTENLKNLSDIELLLLKDLFYTYNGELEDSLELTEEIIKKHPDEYVGYLFQSITYFFMGQFNRAFETIETGLSKDNNASLIAQKAQLLINIDHDKALGIVEEALAEFPDNFLLQRTKFLCILTDKECCIKAINEPLEYINSLIEANPKDLELSVMKALLYTVTNNYKEGKDWIKQVVEFNLLKRNPRVDTAAYLILSYSYLARGKFEKALDIVNKVKFHYANHPLSHIITGLVHGFNIVYKFDASKTNKKFFVEEFEKAISMEPSEKQLSRYYQLYSYILNETDGTEAALVEIEKAIELSPDHFDIYATKIHLFLTNDNMKDEVMALIEKMMEKFPQMRKSLYQLRSFTYYAMDKYLEVIKTIDEALELYPDSTGLLNNRAISLSNLGRYDEAFEAIEQAIELDPLDANLYDSYGEVLMISKNYKGAIEKFTQALEANPRGWFAFHTFLKLAKSYKHLEMRDEASTCYAKAQMLTEKVIPGKRKLYMDQLQENFDDFYTSQE
jgi:tetratricopeptide (TPR) repeat protein/Mn-dependent DtxR family transcriptional regulator